MNVYASPGKRVSESDSAVEEYSSHMQPPLETRSQGHRTLEDVSWHNFDKHVKLATLEQRWYKQVCGQTIDTRRYNTLKLFEFDCVVFDTTHPNSKRLSVLSYFEFEFFDNTVTF